MVTELNELRAAVDVAEERVHQAETVHVQALHDYQRARDRRVPADELAPLRSAIDTAQEGLRRAEDEHVDALHRYQLALEAEREAHRDRQGQEHAAAVASGHARGVMDGKF